MKLFSLVFTTLVAVEHIFILVVEMFFWDSELGMKIFKTTQDFATASKVLAANQGLYNGFLASGLIWALLFIKENKMQREVKLFFLGCIIVAGIFGGLTAKFSIIFTQGGPAFLAFLFTYLAKDKE